MPLEGNLVTMSAFSMCEFCVQFIQWSKENKFIYIYCKIMEKLTFSEYHGHVISYWIRKKTIMAMCMHICNSMNLTRMSQSQIGSMIR